MRGIALRSDFDAPELRAAARGSKSGARTRRLLSLAAIDEGCGRSEAAKIGGVTLQIVRDWVVKFNAEGPDGLIDRTAPGRAPLLNAARREALAAVVESGPLPAIHGVVRWRIVDLGSLLLCLEHPHRPTLAHDVPRNAPMGTWVLINEGWYKR